MRDGRRNRLGLQTGTEGTVQDTYLDRILSDEEAAGQSNILNLDPDANVNTLDNRYVQDAYNYYLGGGLDDYTEGTDLETGQQDFTGGQMIDTGGGGGGEGQATSGVDTTTTGDSDTNFDGVDYVGPDFYDDSGNVINQDWSDPTDFSQSQLQMDNVGGEITNNDITVENIAQDQTPYDVPSGLDIDADSGTSIENIIAQQNLQPISAAPEISQQLQDEGPTTVTGMLSNNNMVAGPMGYLQNETQVSGADYSQADIDAERLGAYSPSFGNVSQVTDDSTTQQTISNAFTKGKQAITDGLSSVTEIGQSIADTIGGVWKGEDQTISVFGKEINVPTTLAGITLGQAVNFPVTLAFGAVKGLAGLLPKDSQENITTRKIVAELQGNNYGGYNITKGNLTTDPFGRPPVSAAGTYAQTLADDLASTKTDPLSLAKKKYAKDFTDKKDAIDAENFPGEGKDAEVSGAVTTGSGRNPYGYKDDLSEADTIDSFPGEGIDAEDSGVATGVDSSPGQAAADAAAAANAAATARAAADLAASQRRSGGGGNTGGSGDANSPGGGGGYCFDPSTPIQMADGSNKKIKNIQLGDDTKGGEVTGVFQFKAADEIHNYKGVTVAGSHYVKEDGEFIMVKDSPLAVKIDKIPVVYSLDTSGRRIFIKDIEFADYNGDGVAKNFLSNAGVDLKGFDKEVLRQVQQRLI
tara:strand:+ start:442 stop:2526 length:2085 start_codon:yes stop_codon:yes gene_type:complete